MKKLIYALSLILIFASAFMLTGCNETDTNLDDTKKIAVTAISVMGSGDKSIIDRLGGTLLLTATITPANATDDSVTWTVVDGTGSAIITSTGLLTAVRNGTVTANATSVSNKGVKGTKVITISNQAEVDMNTTLTDLTVNGVTLMGFRPLHGDYVMVLNSGSTTAPVTVATKYQASATVVITPAIDVTSDVMEHRTTTIVVTTENSEASKTYKIIFESSVATVDLGSANDFVVLAKTGISTATTSDITGSLGVSPAAATYITGFSLTMDSTGFFSTSSQVTGNVYSSDYTAPTPTKLTTAVSDMQTAYSDAAGRAANYTELYAGDLSGKTLTAGVYNYGNGVLINTDLTLTGNATDVWIFQISGSLAQAANKSIILVGGALAKNIFWQVADTVSIGTGSHFEGIILAMTNISVGTNASINGQLYAQTAVTLDANIIKKP